MSLPLIADTIEALPEAVRSFYEETDGKFRLKVDGIEDTTNLKKTLDKEREGRKELEKEVKRWRGLGRSDSEIASLLQAQEEAETKRLKDAGDHDAILKQHQSRWDKERAELIAERDALAASERAATVGNTLVGALAKAGVSEEGLELLQDRLAKRIKSETVDGQRLHRVMAADGVTPLAGTASDGFATLDDLVLEAQAKYPSLFKAKGNGGSGTPPKSSGGTARVMTSAAFAALPAKERADLMASGVTLKD